MSGIVGLLHRNGNAVSPAVIQRMTDGLRPRGPDGVASWLSGAVGLGHGMLRTTPESHGETQPFHDGSFCLTLDGRLDNRADLRMELESRGLRVRTDTDAELVLRAYQCWREDCPAHLLGDFAFAVWDASRRQLFCARDHMGMKPFYYSLTDRLFLFASDLNPLLGHPDVSTELNEGMLGEYLSGQITSQSDTLYRHIFRLPPSHCLIVGPDRFQVHRYWDVEPSKELRYANDADYREHFRLLFLEAVRCRLRSHRPVGCYLSGGLDSSSIVGAAQSLARNGLPVQGLETFSLVFPGLACDESAYIENVTRLWKVQTHTACIGGNHALPFADWAKRDRDFPGYPNGAMGEPLRDMARQRGLRVLLGGTGGDEWLTGTPYHLADLIQSLKFPSLIKHAWHASMSGGFGATLHSVLRYGCWPLLSKPIRERFRQALGREGVPCWINKDFANRIHLADRLRKELVKPSHLSYAQTDLTQTLTSGWWIHCQELEERAASQSGLEERHPFCDKRIVEFALALPEDQRWRRGRSKYILREAMQGLLPHSIYQRADKAEFSSVFVQALTSMDGQAIFKSLQTARLGWVDAEQVTTMHGRLFRRSAQGETAPCLDLWTLWVVAGIEIWLRNGLASDHTVQEELVGTTPC